MTDATANFGATTQTAPKPKNEAAAVTALFLAISSLLIWFIPAFVAIVLASSAKRNVRASEGQRKGIGLATAAQVIAGFSLVATTTICVLIAVV